MAAFERVLSGIPEMDKALDNIRLGDNVVFRVSDLSEFKLFVDPYIEQAKKDKRSIHFMRSTRSSIQHSFFLMCIPMQKMYM